jgi:hypothetical protein
MVGHCVHNLLLPSSSFDLEILHCLLVVCRSLIEPLAMALFDIVKKLAEAVLVVWLNEPNVPLSHCGPVFRRK